MSTKFFPGLGRKHFENQINRNTDFLTGFGIRESLLKQQEFAETRNSFSRQIADVVQYQYNKGFHEQLNFFEKLGFVSEEKIEHHRRMASIWRGATYLLVDLGFSLLPEIVSPEDPQQKIIQLKSFIFPWIRIVNQNQEASPFVVNRARKFYRFIGENFSWNDFSSFYKMDVNEEFSCDGKESLEIFRFICSCADSENPDTRKNIRQLAEEMGIRRSESGDEVDQIHDDLEVISDAIGLSGITIARFSKELLTSFENSKEHAIYAVENDPFFEIRKRRRELILDLGEKVAIRAASEFRSNFLSLVIPFAGPMVDCLVNEEMDPRKSVVVVRKISNIIE